MGKHFSTPRRGFVVKDGGKLYEFKRDSITVSKAWPPVRYQKTRKKPYWHYTRIDKLNYNFEAIRYSICMTRGISPATMFEPIPIPEGWPPKWLAPLAKFYEPIPVEVREFMLGTDSWHFIDTPWNFCAFFARCKDAGEITRSSPATAYMLANLPVFRKDVRRRWETVRRLAGKPRREILGYLGWPDSEAMARIVAKIPIESCCKKNLLLLRAVVTRSPETVKPLSHVRRLNNMNLEMICRRRYKVRSGWRLIDEVGQICSERYPDSGGHLLFEDTVRMEELLGMPATPIKSVEHLEKRHERAVKVLNNCDIAGEGRSGEFPPPPVPTLPASGDFEIYPVDDPVKLCKEGMEQQNCVSSYCGEIARAGGGIYVYSLRKPERATVKIERRPGRNNYYIGEIKGPCNREVAASTVVAVNRWLDTFSRTELPPDMFSSIGSDGMLPEFHAPAPQTENFSMEQVHEPGILVTAMMDFNMEMKKELMGDILRGGTFAFLMKVPEKALIFVSKDRCGCYEYDSARRFGELSRHTEKLLDAWLEAADLINLARGNPDQLSFEFENMTKAG
jgi:hypothetical protein